MKRWLALLALAPVLLLTAPAGANAPDATGWWSRARLGPLVPAEVPSTVPAGGLYVAGDPTGPFGVSALRLAVGDAEVGDLVLEVASAHGTPAVRACPAVGLWADEQGGRLDSAPKGDCEVAVATGTVDGATVRIPVGALVHDGVLNVVLEPEPGAVFEASFAAPGDQAVTVKGAPAPFTPFDASPVLTPPSAMTELPAMSAAVPVEAPAAVPVEGPAAVTGRGTTGGPARLAAPVVAVGEGDRPKVLALMVLVDLAIAAALLLRHRAPEAAPLGIGRFARPRTGPVPRL